MNETEILTVPLILLRLTGKAERRVAPEHRLFDVHLVERESCAECAQ